MPGISVPHVLMSASRAQLLNASAREGRLPGKGPARVGRAASAPTARLSDTPMAPAGCDGLGGTRISMDRPPGYVRVSGGWHSTVPSRPQSLSASETALVVQGTGGPELPPRILLVDCDQFYVQVARLEDPDALGDIELLVVGGSATGRGVVTSASYAARAFGVRSAMPTSQALRLCPDATVTGVPREACARRSREVRKVLDDLAPVVQAASIDEFYLDLTGTERLFHGETLEDTAWRLR